MGGSGFGPQFRGKRIVNQLGFGLRFPILQPMAPDRRQLARLLPPQSAARPRSLPLPPVEARVPARLGSLPARLAELPQQPPGGSDTWPGTHRAEESDRRRGSRSRSQRLPELRGSLARARWCPPIRLLHWRIWNRETRLLESGGAVRDDRGLHPYRSDDRWVAPSALLRERHLGARQ